MRVGIAGSGVVGGALAYWLREHTKHEVVIHDPPRGIVGDFQDASAIFICVPAATLPTGLQDLSAVRDVLATFRSRECPFFIRTTILPGTIGYLRAEFGKRIYAMPEFLTERHADRDVSEQDIVCGSDSELDATLLMDIFPNKTIHAVSNDAACMGKYLHNVAAATRVNLANQVYGACQAAGIAYGDVVKVARLSGHIGPAHLEVPGPDGRQGFGGKCFPKDLSAFAQFLRDLSVPAGSLSAVERENATFRGRE